MNRLSFFIVDVFAEEKCQGNQLAVFLNAENLSKPDMQKIAKEINFSESAFILSDTKLNNGYNVKIFTPDAEVPFAGHPTLGTAFIIHKEIEYGLSDRINLNLGVGQIPVTFEKNKDLWMKQNSPMFGKSYDKKIIAEVLSIDEDDIDSNFPIQVVSTGLPSIIVPLKSLSNVQKCYFNRNIYRKYFEEGFSANILVFCNETYNDVNDLNVRIFCPDLGIAEDPATGSGNGNLAGYLLEYDYFKSKKLNYRVEQGYEIGRPSLLKVKASIENDKFDINVGGNVFVVAKGEWFV